MLCFWGWENKTAGGMQTVIHQLAKEANRVGEKIRLYGFDDSFVYNQLMKDNVDFEFYDLRNMTRELAKGITASDTVVITGIAQFPMELTMLNPRVFYWMVYLPSFSIPNTTLRHHFKYYSRRVVKILEQANALVFMDDSCIREIKTFYSKFTCNKILPVPFEMPEKIRPAANRVGDRDTGLQLSYVGRAAPWKVIPVKKLVADLETRKISCCVHIITDNSVLFKELLQPGILNYVKLKFPGQLVNNMLHDYLHKHIDIHTGMGMAALEGAALGLPTIVLDTDNVELPEQYSYQWLFEMKGGSLGDFIGSRNTFKGRKIQQMVREIMDSANGSASLGVLCRQHVIQHHCVEHVYAELNISASVSSARFNDFYPLYLTKSAFYRFLLQPLKRAIGWFK